MLANRTQGAGSILIALGAAILISVLLVGTATLMLSARRTTTDQRYALEAQYAAEAGLNRAYRKIGVINRILTPRNLVPPEANRARDAATFMPYVTAFCAGTPLTSDQLTPAQQAAMPSSPVRRTCRPPYAAITTATQSRFDLLSDMVNADGYYQLIKANSAPGATDADMRASAQAMADWTKANKQAFWNRFLMPASNLTSLPTGMALAPQYDTQAQVVNARVEAFYPSGSGTSANPVMVRFFFKPRVVSLGSRPNDVVSRRVLSAATGDDASGETYIEFQFPAPGNVRDSSRSLERKSYSGNISNLLGIESRIENQYSVYSDTPDSYERYAAQFRDAFGEGMTYDTPIHTNEFLTFPKGDDTASGTPLITTFNSTVTSAGCKRRPMPANFPDGFAGLPSTTQLAAQGMTPTDLYLALFKPNPGPGEFGGCDFTMNAYGRRVDAETIFMTDFAQQSRSAGNFDGLTPDQKNAQLLQAAQTFASNRLRFSGGDPVFNAPYRTIFNVQRYSTLRRANGNPMDEYLDSDLYNLRQASQGLDSTRPNTIGLNIDDLVAQRWVESRSKGQQPNIMDATVRLLVAPRLVDTDITAADTAHIIRDMNRLVWNATQQKYVMNNGTEPQYQYIEIQVKGFPTNNLTGVPCTPAKLNFRVDSQGNIQEYKYPHNLTSSSQYDCEAFHSALSSEGAWVNMGGIYAGKKFNGVIYNDGNTQLTTVGMEATDSFRSVLDELDGDKENIHPAISRFSKIEIGSGGIVALPKDLVLEDMPCTVASCASKPTPVNSLKIHAKQDIKFQNEQLPGIFNSTATPPIIRNIRIEGSLISSNGELTNYKDMVESGTSGGLPDLQYAHIFGSVVTRYNGEIGRYFPSTNDWRGYHPDIQLDPRIASGTINPLNNGTTYWMPMRSSGSLDAIQLRQGR